MDREKLYDRINKRVDIMIQKGLIEEVENLLKKYNEFPTAMQGLGYKEVVEYIQGKVLKEDMIENIKRESRRYAKRQITWFKKNKQTIWIGPNDLQMILNEIFRKGKKLGKRKSNNSNTIWNNYSSICNKCNIFAYSSPIRHLHYKSRNSDTRR